MTDRPFDPLISRLTGCVAAPSAAATFVAVLLAGCGSGATPPPTPTTTLPAPSPSPLGGAWSSDFASDDGHWETMARSGGRVDFGVADPRGSDGAVASLLFRGDPSLAGSQRVGPGFATEIDSRRQFLYGTFRTRLRLANCRSNEDVVNGIFTYFNDGSDGNGNGIADNSEIDIEILCSTPSVISLSTWTDYQASPERFLKWTRTVDLATGQIAESPSDHEYGLVPFGRDPRLAHPGFPDPDEYYEMGFDWQARRLRFFVVLDGGEVTLWDDTDARYIPQRPAAWLFNVWHPDSHWFGPGGRADFPSSDAEMRLDWARYEP